MKYLKTCIKIEDYFAFDMNMSFSKVKDTVQTIQSQLIVKSLPIRYEIS